MPLQQFLLVARWRRAGLVHDHAALVVLTRHEREYVGLLLLTTALHGAREGIDEELLAVRDDWADIAAEGVEEDAVTHDEGCV